MKSRTLFLAGLLSLCLVGAVSAQQTTVEGTVVSNSGGTLVVTTAEGQRTFLVDGQSSVPASLASGTRVTIEYQTTSDNQMHAFKVSPVGAAPTSATTPMGSNDDLSRPDATAPVPPPSGTSMTGTTTTSTSPTTAAAQPATTPSYGSRTTTAPATTAPATSATDTTTSAPMTADTSSDRLPATASPLPLIALAGTLALATGLALRRLHA